MPEVIYCTARGQSTKGGIVNGYPVPLPALMLFVAQQLPMEPLYYRLLLCTVV